MKTDLHARARRYLSKLPPAIEGSGGHDATFRAACVLVHGFSLDEATALEHLREWNLANCQPPWSESELAHKVKSALASPSDKPQGYLLEGETTRNTVIQKVASPLPTRPPKWPAFDLETLQRIVADRISQADLWSQSPIMADPGPDAEELIDSLFPPDSLLCVGDRANHAITTNREELRGTLANRQFIVPSPMKAKKGKTLEGKESFRCLDNTGPRRFLVIECDFLATDKHGQPRPEAALLTGGRSVRDLCAAVLWHLATIAPLALVVYSGGKSLHGWFVATGQPSERLRAFHRYAVSLGADRATWNPCQFVRMPQGTRADGTRQSLLYFNPALIPNP